jgi:ATP-dependent protease ClpP protease subunit
MPDLKRLTALAGQLAQKAEKRAHRPENGRWYRITNATSEKAAVYLYGQIGMDWWGEGNSAAQFAQDMQAITAREIELHVNSEGGQVFEGIAIHTTIAEHPAAVTGIVDGLAASAASFILMACDTVKMARAAKMMIHDAGTGFAVAQGNAAELREFAQEVLDTADLLDELSDTIADLYAEKAGGTRGDWRDIMRAERWYSAADAVKAGLADEIIGQDGTTDSPTPAESEVEAAFDVDALLVTLKGAWADA